MQYADLNIDGFEENQLVSFSLIKEINKHSKCSFSFKTNKDDYLEYMNSVGSDIKINNGEEYIFFGIIEGVSVNNHFCETIVTINAVSDSIKIDQKPMKRIFQNPEKTFDSIVSYLKKEDGFEAETSFKEKICEPLLQCDESDFSFLLRLACKYGMYIIADDTAGHGKIKINITSENEDKTEKIKEIPEKLKFNISQSLNGYSSDNIVIVLRNTYYNIGEKLKFGEFKGYVSKINIYMEKYMIFYEYTLLSNDSKIKLSQPDCPERVVLSGTVEDNDEAESSPKGMIKVKFNCDYIDAEPEKMMWIPYRTPYISLKGGIVFIPDKGDCVQVVYGKEKMWAEEIFNSTPIPEELRNFKNKYIANIYGKRITLAEEQLEIRSDENTAVLTKDNIILTVEDSTVSINKESVSFKVKECGIVINENSVEISTGDTKILIDKNITVKSNQIQLEASDKTSVKTDKEVLLKSSELQIQTNDNISFKAGKNIDLSGNKINLK